MPNLKAGRPGRLRSGSGSCNGRTPRTMYCEHMLGSDVFHDIFVKENAGCEAHLRLGAEEHSRVVESTTQRMQVLVARNGTQNVRPRNLRHSKDNVSREDIHDLTT